MQYISSFSPLQTEEYPSSVFFSDADNLPEYSLQEIPSEDFLRKARSVLGLGPQLNPIQGIHEEKHYFTFLRHGHALGYTFM